jgi:ABC-2 type transport system permease protein
MTRNVTAELLVLRKRAATWILLGIWTFLGIFFAYVIPYVSDNPADSPAGLEQFLPESLAGDLLAGFPFFGGVFALMLGVFALGSEYGWGTLKTLFTQRPGRLRVLAAKLAALGIVLVPFVLALFAAGAVASYVIAQIEDAPVTWPSAWLLVRAMAAGWLILAVWAALGVLLGVVTRGTSLAIGVGILYALVIEGLLSAFADNVGVLEPLTNVFLRANGYSIATGLGASRASIESNGPGSFAGPFVDSPQALAVLVALSAGFLALSGLLLRRRDIA